LDVSRAAVFKVMTAFKNLGKALSAKRNTGRKPKLSKRDRCIFKRIVSRSHRTAATKVTAELSIHLENRFHKNSPTGASLIQVELQLLDL
jgi:transposase